MRIFVAGATGAIGKQLVPALVERGHEVTGLTRTGVKRGQLEAMGATAAVADALDPDALGAAVATAEPEVIVHQLTAIPASIDFRDLRKPDRTFALTNRLRTEGTDHLLAAGRAVGARRFVAQSFAGWPFARTGGPVKDENAPLDADPPAGVREASAAIRHLERAVTDAEELEGLVLRYGGFYGPATSLAPGEEMVEAVRKRRFPIIGDGGGVWSFIHIADAAAATVAAIERGEPGIYNIADDEPAPVSEWLPYLAKVLGAKPPRRLPRWLGKIVAGTPLVTQMTEIRGVANAKAKSMLGWSPTHASWRQGFQEVLG